MIFRFAPLSVAVVLLTGFFGLASPAAAQPVPQTLHLVGDAAYAPYSFNYGGTAKGIDVEVVQELGIRLGLDIRLELTSRTEMLRMLREGQCDGVLSLRPTAENKKLALLLRRHPLHVGTYSAFMLRAARFDVNGPDDLKGHSVGIAEGTDLGAGFRKMVRNKELTVTEYSSKSAAIGALLRREVEVFIGQTRAVHHLLDKGGMSGTVQAEGRPLYKRGGEYLGLSMRSAWPDKEKLLALMELALADIFADGTYRRILHRYVL